MLSKQPEQARAPEPAFGHDLLGGIPAELMKRPIVLTQAEPWPAVSHHFDPDTSQMHMVETLDHDVVAAKTESFDSASAVFGIGGGSALHHAKYTAWKKKLPLVLTPTILSVEAALSGEIVVRENRKMRVKGEIRPDHLLVDYSLLQAAPPSYNRAGVGDILSIFTALWDWREASARLGEAYDEEIAEEAQGILGRLMAQVLELRMVTEDGLRMLIDLYREMLILCERAGSQRPLRGSEHYLAYCLESRTERNFLHGHLISLCVRIVADYQGQDSRMVQAFLRDLQLDCTLSAVGLTSTDIRTALLGMGDFIKDESHLPAGIFHFNLGCSPSDTECLLGII